MPHINPVALDPLDQIQRALYDLLNDGLSAPVFDFVPEDQAYPYVAIGEATQVPDNAHDQYGSETTHVIHVWTEAEGWTQANSIADEVVRLLDHQQQNLVMDDHRAVSIRREMTRTMRDPDPRIRHVPLRFRIITEQTGGE